MGATNLLCFACLVASASAFVAAPLAAGRSAVAPRPATPTMVPVHMQPLDAPSPLLADGPLQLPLPAFTPAKVR